MRATTARTSLVPVLALAVGLGVGGCQVEKVTKDDPATTSSVPAGALADAGPPSAPASEASPTNSVSGHNSREASGGTLHNVPADYTLPQDIELGTCYLRLPDTYDLSDAIKVDCAQPHFIEIISTFTWPKEYADFQTDEWNKQSKRCDTDNVSLVSAAQKKGGASGWSADKRRVWAPSVTQLSDGQGTGYCTVSGWVASDLFVGSVVSGSLTKA